MGAHATHCAGIPRVGAAGAETALRSGHLVALLGRVRVEEGLAQVLIFRCTDSDLVGLFTTQQDVILSPETEGSLAKNTGVALSGGACRHGLSIYLDREMEKLAREKPALRSGFADTAA